MDATINRNDTALPLAPEALHAFAGKVPLDVILQEIRGFNQAQDQPGAHAGPDYPQLCDTWMRSLDAQLARLETHRR